MKPFDAAHVTGLLSERRSRLDVDEPGALHNAITPGPDVPVQRLRPIVADLVGPGRMGLGTLLAPADPMAIMDGFVLPVRRRHVCVPGLSARAGRPSEEP
jgi:hypothetical protein